MNTYTIEEHTAGEWRLFANGKLVAIFPASIRNTDRDAKANAEMTMHALIRMERENNAPSAPSVATW